jgi:hypothetical protein
VGEARCQPSRSYFPEVVSYNTKYIIDLAFRHDSINCIPVIAMPMQQRLWGRASIQHPVTGLDALATRPQLVEVFKIKKRLRHKISIWVTLGNRK